MAKPKTPKARTSEAKTSEAKTIIDDDAKNAMYVIQHLELDLQQVKQYLKNIEEYSHQGGGGGTGASKELSHQGGGGGTDASKELSHQGGSGGTDASKELSHQGGQ